jgi:hypothetical protein
MKSVRFFRFIVMVLLVAGLPACATEPTAAEKKLPPALPWNVQIIVKFRNPGFEPTRGDFLARRTAEIGVKLDYVRPMSGGAHVLRVPDGTRSADVDRVVELLGSNDEVLYAERDRRMRALGDR